MLLLVLAKSHPLLMGRPFPESFADSDCFRLWVSNGCSR